MIFSKFISLVKRLKIPNKHISEILGFKKPINMGLVNLRFQKGNVSEIEILYIALLAQHLKPQKVFEIGTFDGSTTLQIAANTNNQTEIYTLDIKPEDINSIQLFLENKEKQFINKKNFSVGEKFIGTKYGKKIKQLWGDSAKFDFSPYYKKMDFIFVDGSHSYDYVENDTEKALKMIRKGGVILWHDYNKDWPGVMKYLNELSKKIRLINIAGTSLVYYRYDHDHLRGEICRHLGGGVKGE